MPLFTLEICGEFDNIKELVTSDTSKWMFLVKCQNCGADHDKPVYIEQGIKHDVPGSRGSAHLVMKVKCCERVSTIEWVEPKGASLKFFWKTNFLTRKIVS